MDPARRNPDQRVARVDAPAGDDRVELHEPDAEAHEVEAARRRMAAHHVGQHRELPAGDLNAGLLGARTQSDADLLEHVGVGLLNGDVVEQRDRIGPDADHVVRVHPEQVDPDRVVAPELLADDHLRPDAVARQREAALLVEPQDVRVVAARQRGAGRAAGPDSGQHLHQRRDGVAGQQLVDTGACVCPFGHGPHSSGTGVRRAAAGSGGAPQGERHRVVRDPVRPRPSRPRGRPARAPGPRGSAPGRPRSCGEALGSVHLAARGAPRPGRPCGRRPDRRAPDAARSRSSRGARGRRAGARGCRAGTRCRPRT